jgi:hypothetical protein
MKIHIAFLVAFSVSSLLASDFRKSDWGMTEAQVLATESGQPSEVRESGGERIVRYDSVPQAGLDARLIYIFAKDKLVRAKYIFLAEHDEANDFIADFRTIEPVLMEKFGKPASERAIWENYALQEEKISYLEQDRALPSDILPSDRFAGLAVSLGHLKLYVRRDTARTKIVHTLTGADNTIVHQIEYTSAPGE